MNTLAQSLKWDANGLIPVIVQDRHTGEVRMLAYANQEALELTLSTRLGHFYSRSRQSIWKKGQSSGHLLHVKQIWADCDGDTLLYLIDPQGPSCHTGAQNCFFHEIIVPHHETPPSQTENPTNSTETKLLSFNQSEDQPVAAPTLVFLWRKLQDRLHSSTEKSYTKSLVEKGALKISEKLIEESNELSEALQHESESRVLSETADLFYHMLVGLLARQQNFRQVIDTLAQRFSQSGHEEKASRKKTKGS